MPRGSKHWKNFVVLACLSRSITSTRRECFSARMQGQIAGRDRLADASLQVDDGDFAHVAHCGQLLVAYLLVFIFSAAIW